MSARRTLVGSVSSTLLVTSLLACWQVSGVRAASPARVCLPLGGLVVENTIRKRVGDHDEVTEPLGGGIYRITRCDFEGVLIRSMLVEPIRDSGGRATLAPAMIVRPKLVISIDYGDPRDPLWDREWRRVRAKVAASVLPETRGTPRPDPAYDPDNATGSRGVAFAAAGGACEDGGYLKTGGKWQDQTYSWRWKSESFGVNYDSRDAFKAAHNAWNTTHTNCDYDDITKIKPVYEGSTGKSAGKHDGVGTVDKGSLTAIGCAGGLACTISWREGNGHIESDTRFEKSFKWTNNGAPNAYDYRAVGTHEFGHTIGLADLHNHPNLTMFYGATIGTTKWRTLGRSDIRGLRALYP